MPETVRVRIHVAQRPPVLARGYAERVVRARLEEEGWTVWRSDVIGADKDAEVYPNVRRKYGLLRELLDAHMRGMAEELEYLARVHHGMPDFLCFRRGAWRFVECKYRHECLGVLQKHCIRRLQLNGFAVEVHAVVLDETKARSAELSTLTWKKRVVERQRRLVQRW